MTLSNDVSHYVQHMGSRNNYSVGNYIRNKSLCRTHLSAGPVDKSWLVVIASAQKLKTTTNKTIKSLELFKYIYIVGNN